jgi:NAD(P)-dependent dehydrogenase (short-subunit alcohol dehydrogenase family)
VIHEGVKAGLVGAALDGSALIGGVNIARRGRRPRRVAITGGSSGIGLATARRLIEDGAHVVLIARGADGLADADRKLGGAATISADVAAPAAIHDALAQAAELLGGLDAVVAAAGAASYGPFVASAADDYERTIRTTLLGLVNTAHAALPHLQATRGSLVVVGSVAGRLPTPWLATYAAAKHGVRGFVRSLACELRALRVPVAVSLIAPGPVDTPFWRRARTPDRRLPPELRGVYRAEDVAAEITRALYAPGRVERTVGGLFGPAIIVDALMPNRVLPTLGVLARLGWRARHRSPRSDEDGLSGPTTTAEQSGGLSSRGSSLRKLRDLATGDGSGD